MQILQSFLGYFYPNKCMLCRSILSSLDDSYICRICYSDFKDKYGGKKYNMNNNMGQIEEVVFEPKLSNHKDVLFEEGILEEINDKEKILEIGQVQDKEDRNNIEDLQETLGVENVDEADFNTLEYILTKVITLFPYESTYRKAILRWKYGGYRKYAKGFAKLLVEEQLVMPTENAVLVPIPLAPSRMKKRGYNQALDLAAEISKLTDIPVLDCLRRIHDTKPQVACTKEERYTNAKNSMKCNDDKSAKKINTLVLIDDIYTTGSTIREAIRVIKRQYIFRDAHIYAVVVGKGTL